MTVQRTSSRIANAKIAIWLETEDGKGSLAIFEPFEGAMTVDFNLADHVTSEGWVDAERIPGGHLEINGSYRLVHTAHHVDPPALLAAALDRRAGREEQE